MSTKHTPGPWKAIGTRVYFPNLSGGFDISKCPSPEENARLIAAAPDLLEACMLARNAVSEGMALQKFIDAAIYRATGEQA